jgi:hypothetical protein
MQSKNSIAMLTSFNEVNLGKVMGDALRDLNPTADRPA